MYEQEDTEGRPRSLFWILLPVFLGLIGSVILHWKLTHDKVKFKDYNTVNWIVGLIATTSPIIFDMTASDGFIAMINTLL